MTKVTFEFDPHEDREELRIYQHASDMYSAIWEIESYCRDLNKNGSGMCDQCYKIIDSVRKECWESGVMDV